MFRIFMLVTLSAVLAFGAEADKDKPADTAFSGDTVQTPFGPAKKQTAAPKPAVRRTASKPLVDVALEGDTYTFTRQTPFGSQTWKRATADLSADEKKLIADQEEWDAHKAEQAKPKAAPAPTEKPQS